MSAGSDALMDSNKFGQASNAVRTLSEVFGADFSILGLCQGEMSSGILYPDF